MGFSSRAIIKLVKIMKVFSLLLLGLIVAAFGVSMSRTVRAQELVIVESTPEASEVATISALIGVRVASDSAEIATSSTIVRRVVRKEPNITEPEPEIQGKLERFLVENPPGPLSLSNFIQHSIVNAVSQGVPANTIVLILLFPLIATIVVIARHIVGLKSFGIFTPALLSVALLSTGLFIGILLYVLILIVASIARQILRKMRIQYLPRMALFMWFITMSIFSTVLLSPVFGFEELITIGIFPILILILVTESYLDVQITRSLPQALAIALESIVVALTCYFVINMEMLQRFALVNPELFTVGLLALIALVERYSGLRLMEMWRFRKLLG